MTQTETGLQVDKVLNIVFFQNLFEGFDNIVGTFQVAGTANAYFDCHFNRVLLFIIYSSFKHSGLNIAECLKTQIL